MLEEAGDFAAALALFTTVLNIYPENAKLRGRIDRLRAQLVAQLAPSTTTSSSSSSLAVDPLAALVQSEDPLASIMHEQAATVKSVDRETVASPTPNNRFFFRPLLSLSFLLLRSLKKWLENKMNEHKLTFFFFLWDGQKKPCHAKPGAADHEGLLGSLDQV